ncbi:MAG TPA: 8-oxo-dGTP diphosphatase [Bacillota bacterium]|nr:8-oxo-dGTP diphosphatase [Bacillota bacterium]
MQRVTNSILRHDDHILLLKKPRRGWYAFPGGKMERNETIKESAIREFQEETGLTLIDPDVAGIFTFTIFEDESFVQEWMMFTFICETFTGELTDHCLEGELEWVPISQLHQLPMAAGDKQLLNHIVHSNEILYGSFSYTTDYDLLESRLDPSRP